MDFVLQQAKQSFEKSVVAHLVVTGV